MSVGDAAGAARLLRKARERYPDDVFVNLGLASALEALQPARVREAARYVRAALALVPDNQILSFRLAFTLVRAGEWEGAVAAWRTMLAKDPENPLIHAQLTSALVNLGDLQGAQEAAEQAVKLAPQDRNTRSSLLHVVSQRANKQAFLDAVEQAIKDFPDASWILGRRVFALVALGRLDEAQKAADAALEKHPDDPSVVAAAAFAAMESVMPGKRSRCCSRWSRASARPPISKRFSATRSGPRANSTATPTRSSGDSTAIPATMPRRTASPCCATCGTTTTPCSLCAARPRRFQPYDASAQAALAYAQTNLFKEHEAAEKSFRRAIEAGAGAGRPVHGSRKRAGQAGTRRGSARSVPHGPQAGAHQPRDQDRPAPCAVGHRPEGGRPPHRQGYRGRSARGLQGAEGRRPGFSSTSANTSRPQSSRGAPSSWGPRAFPRNSR